MKFYTANAWRAARSTMVIGLVFSSLISACAGPQPESTLVVQTAQSSPTAASPTPGVVGTASAVPASSATPQPTTLSQSIPTQAGAIDGPLSVVIESPPDNSVVSTSPIEISGQADPETVISINDILVLVPENRHFSVQVALDEGINLIEIVASDLNENQEVFYLTVDYERQP